MRTECSTERMDFHPHGKREVHGRFDGGRITSDGGSPLLRELEAQTGIVAAFAECFADSRDPSRTEHSLKELLAQRIFALAQGCEDLNDHDSLRLDPALALTAGKEDIEGAAGGARPTRASPWRAKARSTAPSSARPAASRPAIGTRRSPSNPRAGRRRTGSMSRSRCSPAAQPMLR